MCFYRTIVWAPALYSQIQFNKDATTEFVVLMSLDHDI